MSEHSDVVTRIIACVKQYPALYDTTHEDYNRYHKKIQIWNNIAAEVNYSDGKVAQTKWRNIRDSYVKHLKSLQTKEPAYKKYRNWQWVEQMSFLRKFLGGNRHKGSKNDSQSTSLIDVVESVYSENSSFVENENLQLSVPSTPLAPKSDLDGPSWFDNPMGDQQPSYDCDSFYAQSKDFSMECKRMDPSLDATDLLFLSYSKTLKLLSKKRQIGVKMKISDIMGQAELDEENEKARESNHVDSSGNDDVRPTSSKKMKRLPSPFLKLESLN